MLDMGCGNIIVIGATASVRGGANFTLCVWRLSVARKTMARDVNPQAFMWPMIIDGIIDLPRTRVFMPDKLMNFLA